MMTLGSIELYLKYRNIGYCTTGGRRGAIQCVQSGFHHIIHVYEVRTMVRAPSVAHEKLRDTVGAICGVDVLIRVNLHGLKCN